MEIHLNRGAGCQPGLASRFDNLNAPMIKSLTAKEKQERKIGFPAGFV